MPDPPLTPLHPYSSLSPAKLDKLKRLSTETLQHSLRPGLKDAFKVRPDGTILDGHHRIKILRERGVDVDRLPRETIVRE